MYTAKRRGGRGLALARNCLRIQLNLLLKLILHIFEFAESQGGVGMERTKWLYWL